MDGPLDPPNLEDTRPAKRPTFPAAPEPSMAVTAAHPAHSAHPTRPAHPAVESTCIAFWSDVASLLDSGWAWSTPTSAQEAPQLTSQVITPGEGVEANALLSTVVPPPPPVSAAVDGIGLLPSSIQPAVISTGPHHDFSLSYQPSSVASLEACSPLDGSLVLPTTPANNFPGVGATSAKPAIHHGWQTKLHTPVPDNGVLESPFRDCVGKFGFKRSQSFHRPVDGLVNGYIKFAWPKEHKNKNPPSRTPAISQASRITELDDSSESHETATSSSSVAITGPRGKPTAVRDVRSDLVMPHFNIDFSTYASHTADVRCYNAYTSVSFSSSPAPHDAVGEVASMGAPRLIPSHYGYEAKMDNTDRRFWMFYIRNWCPGRSILDETNLWLKDFAQMHKSIGVRSAIQSLAGIYIYDYQPLESIRSRVNQRFEDAEKRFTQLLNDPATYRDEYQASELITISVILSMRDIVLTEARLKNPFVPRWLQGFRRGEELLQATDHGSRFWKTSNVQTPSLRISQSVIVGRAVILAQLMSPLPLPEDFNVEREASRFGWLLYGTEKDMYQIHGGCGFSKKLLHIFSQVTYCAARLHQDAESPVVPMTAEYIHQELLNMRQWSPESQDWDVVKHSTAVIEWVRRQPPGYKIDENPVMTDVTAEVWRIAAILYLLCRFFRLPRNHPKIVSHLDDLVQCIAIMPTSGMQFTAQAPLFPVFLLGILSTLPRHRATSKQWFDEVLQTPVRSSVPPLYAALKKIWGWIDIEFAPSLPSNLDVAAPPIHLRHAWWEVLVYKVQEQENEVLCLT
ncbi:hypothetical protein E4U41_007402 [Claviceps citrina]|nr:hypothetical protein E4U41_007402 [Claviceps citrina]